VIGPVNAQRFCTDVLVPNAFLMTPLARSIWNTRTWLLGLVGLSAVAIQRVLPSAEILWVP